MSKLSRYVGATVGASICIVLFLIVGLDIVSAIIDESGELRGNYAFGQSIYYVMLTIPQRINEYIPLSVLIGCLAGMGVLATNSELIVMRATGLSLLHLVIYALKPAIVVIVVSLLISEYVAPITEGWAKTYKDIRLWGVNHSLVSSRGLWHKEEETYMHFSVVQPGGVLLGITFFEFDDNNELKYSRTAKRANYLSNRWVLVSVVETRFSDEGTESFSANTMDWLTKLTPDSLAFLASEPEDMAPSRLYEYSRYLKQNNLDNKHYELAFWQKMLQPLAIFSLVLIALSFVFGPLRETTMGFRIFIGIIVGIAFQFAQNLLGPGSLIYGFPPLIAVLLPVVVCMGVGFILLYRAR